MSGLFIVQRVLAVSLIAAATALMVHLVSDLNRIKTIKTDLAEINHVRYGLLDADQWVSRISAIIEQRVNEFELTPENRPRIKQAVEQVLETLLNEIERYLRQRNLSSGSTWLDQLQGVLQQGVQDLLIDFDRLRKKVPRYADAVVEQLSKPEAKQEIKTQVLALLRHTADATFAKTDRARLEAVFDRHGCADAQVCCLKLETAVTASRLPILQQLGGLVGLVALLFLLCLNGSTRTIRGAESNRLDLGSSHALAGPFDDSLGSTQGRQGFDPFKLLLLTGATLILLCGGLLAPMIEIDARIGQLSLEILGEPLIFTNQVLYFQSKSVFEVVRILAETRAPDMLLVAVLITLFSVIFPALKLIATYLYYYDFRQARASVWVRFFTFRSGKWSMADVLVIAIFMAYLGLDGLVASQLGSLARPDNGVDLLTTNGTSLEPGFYLFLCFVFASLLLSAALEKHFDEGHPN